MSSLGRALRANFLAGLLVLSPAVISLYVFVKLFLMLDRPLGSALTRITGLHIPGVGLAVMVLLTFLAGLLTRNLVGREIVRLARSLISGIPLLGKMYSVLEQTLAMMVPGKGHGFRKVVFVEFPAPGIWSMGLVAGEGGVPSRVDGEMLARIFIPASPNPTTGQVVLVPRHKLRDSELSVEEALRVIVSGGLVLPSGSHGAHPQEPLIDPSFELHPPDPA